MSKRTQTLIDQLKDPNFVKNVDLINSFDTHVGKVLDKDPVKPLSNLVEDAKISGQLFQHFHETMFDNHPTQTMTSHHPYGINRPLTEDDPIPGKPYPFINGKNTVPLFTIEQRRVGFAMNPIGLRKSILLYHSTGSGKSCRQ